MRKSETAASLRELAAKIAAEGDRVAATSYFQEASDMLTGLSPSTYTSLERNLRRAAEDIEVVIRYAEEEAEEGRGHPQDEALIARLLEILGETAECGCRKITVVSHTPSCPHFEDEP